MLEEIFDPFMLSELFEPLIVKTSVPLSNVSEVILIKFTDPEAWIIKVERPSIVSVSDIVFPDSWSEEKVKVEFKPPKSIFSILLKLLLDIWEKLTVLKPFIISVPSLESSLIISPLTIELLEKI